MVTKNMRFLKICLNRCLPDCGSPVRGWLFLKKDLLPANSGRAGTFQAVYCVSVIGV